FGGSRNRRWVGTRLGNCVVQSGLQLAGVQDHESLCPGGIVGHRQMYVDGVAFRRKGVKPRPGATGQLERGSARGRVDHPNVLHEDTTLETGTDPLVEDALS